MNVYFQKNKITPLHCVMFKNNLNWVIELNVGAKTKLGNSFINMTPRAKVIREK